MDFDFLETDFVVFFSMRLKEYFHVGPQFQASENKEHIIIYNYVVGTTLMK